MYDKKDIKYYYLREVQCKLIVNIIIGLVVFNIIFTVAYSIPFPVKLKNFIEDVSAGISLFSGCTVISLFSFIFKNGQNETIGNSINKGHERIINRDIQKNKLLKLSRLHRIIVLTGESGSGKSVLLSNIKEAYYKNNDYFLNWGDEVCRQKNRIIILDQFERALKLSNLKSNINKISSVRKKIIIGIKKENLYDILKQFRYSKYISIFYLDYDESDKGKILSMCERTAGRNVIEFKNLLFYKKLQKRIEDNSIPLILVSLIWKIIGKENISNLDNKLKESDGSFDNMAITYLEDEMVRKLSYQEIAYPILYLLSRDSRFEYKCGINDFKNITFADEKKIKETIDELKTIGLVIENVGKKIYRNEQSTKYEIVHEFYAHKIMTLCTKKISTEIRGNIENYQETYQKKRFEDEEIVDSQYYRNLYCINRRKIVDKMLQILLLVLILENVICWLLKPYDLDYIRFNVIGFNLECFTTNYFILIFLNIAIGLSMYYIYNYYCRFMIVFERRFIVVPLVGGVVSILAIAFNYIWAFFLGLEIFFVGINMNFISKRARESEKLFFNKRMMTFCAIGIMTMILGLSYNTYTKGSNILKIPLFLLYIGYMLMGVWGHINHNYILMILGKIGNEEKYAKK